MLRATLPTMETKPPDPLAVLVGIQQPDVSDVAHEGSLRELERLVKTLGYDVVGRLVQKREGTGAATLLGSGKLEELAALTGGTGVVGSMAPPPKAKARQRFDGAEEPLVTTEAEPDATAKPGFVIVNHELSPSQIRNLERATGAEVLDRTGVIVEIFHRHANTREARLAIRFPVYTLSRRAPSTTRPPLRATGRHPAEAACKGRAGPRASAERRIRVTLA